jgi:transposase
LGIDAIPAALWYSCPTARHAGLLAHLWHHARQRHHEHMCRSVPLDTEGLREQWQRSREGLFAAADHVSKARRHLSHVLQTMRRLRYGEERL